jgi:hypothetical protein
MGDLWNALKNEETNKTCNCLGVGFELLLQTQHLSLKLGFHAMTMFLFNMITSRGLGFESLGFENLLYLCLGTLFF